MPRSAMKSLLQTFIDIALWRKGPQDLPASPTLVWLVGLLYVTAGFAKAMTLNVSLRPAVIMIGADVLMLTAWSWLVLMLFGRPERFQQTAAAVFGAGVVLGLLEILVYTVQGLMGTRLSPDGGLLLFLLAALVFGRIFMQALDCGLMTGMALTVAIFFSIQEVVEQMLRRF